MHPCTISFPRWLSLTWDCPAHPSPLCCRSLLSMLQEFPQVPALLKNSLSMDSQIWSPQCSWGLAICNPLRYSSILPNARVAKMGLVFFIKSMLLVLPFPFTLKRLTYWRKSLLSHSHCLHQDVMKLACVDNTVHSFYGFFVALCVMTDSVFIAVFYVFICIPGSGRSPGEGNATPLVLLPGESHGQRSLVDYSPWDHKESDTTQQLHFLSLHLCIHPEDRDGNWIL